jgi:hypothetical protein
MNGTQQSFSQLLPHWMTHLSPELSHPVTAQRLFEKFLLSAVHFYPCREIVKAATLTISIKYLLGTALQADICASTQLSRLFSG